jgi:hypothetical protein
VHSTRYMPAYVVGILPVVYECYSGLVARWLLNKALLYASSLSTFDAVLRTGYTMPMAYVACECEYEYTIKLIFIFIL